MYFNKSNKKLLKTIVINSDDFFNNKARNVI